MWFTKQKNPKAPESATLKIAAFGSILQLGIAWTRMYFVDSAVGPLACRLCNCLCHVFWQMKMSACSKAKAHSHGPALWVGAPVEKSAGMCKSPTQAQQCPGALRYLHLASHFFKSSLFCNSAISPSPFEFLVGLAFGTIFTSPNSLNHLLNWQEQNRTTTKEHAWMLAPKVTWSGLGPSQEHNASVWM